MNALWKRVWVEVVGDGVFVKPGFSKGGAFPEYVVGGLCRDVAVLAEWCVSVAILVKFFLGPHPSTSNVGDDPSIIIAKFACGFEESAGVQFRDVVEHFSGMHGGFVASSGGEGEARCFDALVW